MAEQEKRFFPTPAKIEELRDEGILPYVPSSAVAVVWLAIAAAFVVGWKNYRELYFGILRAYENNSLESLNQTLIQHAVAIFLVVPAVVILAVFVSGFLQTRFWIELGRAAPQGSRLWQRKRIGGGTFISRLFFAGLALLLGLTVTGLLLWMYGPDTVRLLNADRRMVFEWLKSLGQSMGLSLCVFAAVTYFASLLLGRLLFLNRNRMTKEELEAELRSER